MPLPPPSGVKTRLSLDGYGARRAGDFSGKTAGPSGGAHPVGRITRLSLDSYGARRAGSFAGKTPFIPPAPTPTTAGGGRGAPWNLIDRPQGHYADPPHIDWSNHPLINRRLIDRLKKEIEREVIPAASPQYPRRTELAIDREIARLRRRKEAEREIQFLLAIDREFKARQAYLREIEDEEDAFMLLH